MKGERLQHSCTQNGVAFKRGSNTLTADLLIHMLSVDIARAKIHTKCLRLFHAAHGWLHLLRLLVFASFRHVTTICAFIAQMSFGCDCFRIQNFIELQFLSIFSFVMLFGLRLSSNIVFSR